MSRAERIANQESETGLRSRTAARSALEGRGSFLPLPRTASQRHTRICARQGPLRLNPCQSQPRVCLGQRERSDGRKGTSSHFIGIQAIVFY